MTPFTRSPDEAGDPPTDEKCASLRTGKRGLSILPGCGEAPLTVTIAVPPNEEKKIDACTYSRGWNGPGGNGLSVDWGDGRFEPQDSFAEGLIGTSCSPTQRTHTYRARGRFRVRVTSWHPGPTDAAEIDWEDTAIIDVTGGSEDAKITLVEPRGGETFHYQELPTLRWNCDVGEKVTLRAELLDQDGNVFASEEKRDFAYSGDGSIVPGPENWERYDALLRAGKTRFSARVALWANGRVVAADQSGPMNLSAVFVSRSGGGLSVSSLRGAAPLAVIASFETVQPLCLSYHLDWGDGSAPEVLRRQPPATGCPLAAETLKLHHTYVKPGSYTVTLRSTNLETFKPLDSVVMYEAASIVVL